MDKIEFITLVKDMRSAQKEYFKTRNIDVLKKSKALERRVDEYISSFDRIYVDDLFTGNTTQDGHE